MHSVSFDAVCMDQKFSASHNLHSEFLRQTIHSNTARSNEALLAFRPSTGCKRALCALADEIIVTSATERHAEHLSWRCRDRVDIHLVMKPNDTWMNRMYRTMFKIINPIRDEMSHSGIIKSPAFHISTLRIEHICPTITKFFPFDY